MRISGRISGSLNFNSLLTCNFFLILLDSSLKKVSEAALTTTAAVPVLTHLKVSYACGSTATLAWIGHDASDNYGLEKCELTYYPTEKTSAQILDIYLDSHPHAIKLFNLSRGESYTAFIVCEGFLKTNEVTFYSDSQCEEKNVVFNHSIVGSDSDRSRPSYSHTSSFDTVEWPIAVLFAFVGVIIGAVVAFYMWRKYQRRQRILRIFRQGQNDPFQALYSPTQDTYSF